MGYAHKFEIYSRQENLEKVPGEPYLGATGNMVVRLHRGVPRIINHTIYLDNFYTSLPLVYFLAKHSEFTQWELSNKTEFQTINYQTEKPS